LLGFFLFLGLYVRTMMIVVPMGLIGVSLVLSLFMISVMVCMLCSASFHLFHCHSEQLFQTLLRADLTGVSIQIFGSFMPGLFFGFACAPVWRIVYMACVSVLFLLGIVAPCFPKFHTKELRVVRVLLYTAIAGFGMSGFLQF